jgi:peptide/nickel transport system ATP-binding protein
VTAQATLLAVRDLTLEVARSGHRVVSDFALSLRPGEIVGIVGESGSGKTLAARALLNLTPPPIRRVSGSILLEGLEVTQASPAALRALRGARVGMVFQEPMTSLNPAMTIGEQLEEGLRLHRKQSESERRAAILDMLGKVGLSEPQAALAAHPHQFSGGMRQRIMLASVMLLEPALLIADEPTTALDALVQREVIELMVELTRAKSRERPGTAVLMVSHDLPMVARYTGRIVVMAQGRIVEENTTEELLRRPREAYTRRLLGAMPRRLPARPVSEAAPIVEVKGLVIDYPGRRRLLRKAPDKRALHGIDLTIRPGEVVAVVGGSGSGKTTLGRAIAGLIRPSRGAILFDGRPIAKGMSAWRDYRLNCQMVFQDPYSSLDPRMTLGELIGEGLRLVPGLGPAEKRKRTAEALAEVGLTPEFGSRYPHELSGGQRQRVAIARAVVRRPSFVIADEPVSALDVTVRAQILQLFADLQKRRGFSCLFISHDLAVVEQVADRVVVMQDGRIVEEGPRDAVFDRPQAPYTRLLLSAIPALETSGDGGVRLKWRLEDLGTAPKPGADGPAAAGLGLAEDTEMARPPATPEGAPL